MNALALGPEKGTERPQVRQLEIDDTNAGQRLDNFLLGVCKGVPKSHVYRIVRSGEVRVNQGRVAPDYRLAVGDRVRVPPVRIAESRRPAVVPSEFPVLFEDDGLLAIDKPSGVAVHGGSGVSHGAIEQLRAARPKARMLELVHRIDRETSGVLLIAKKRSVLTGLHEAMREGRVRKHYRLIVRGRWEGGARALRFPLHKFVTAQGERRVVVQDGGQAAGTRVRALRTARHPQFGDVSLLAAELETGRTHQIRVHLAHVGHPLLGDEKYGDFELNKRLEKASFRRMFLHAFSLAMVHPISGETLRLEAPLPLEFDRFLRSCDA